MRADSRNLAVGKDDNLIGVSDRTRALGDDELGAGQLFECFAKLCLRRVVEGGSRIVQNENVGLLDKGAGDGKPLALSARKVFTALRKGFVQALFLGIDDVVCLRATKSVLEVFLARILLSP